MEYACFGVLYHSNVLVLVLVPVVNWSLSDA